MPTDGEKDGGTMLIEALLAELRRLRSENERLRRERSRRETNEQRDDEA